MAKAAFLFSIIFGWLITGGNSVSPHKSFLNGTPEPEMACSTVNRLNIRSGPGTNYGVVGTLHYEHCSSYLGENTDGSWIQIAEGWVSAEFVSLELKPKTPSSNEAVTESEGISVHLTEVIAAKVDIGSESTISLINIPIIPKILQSIPTLPKFINLKEYFYTLNPVEQYIYFLELMYIAGAFFVGLIGSRKFSLIRWVASVVVLIVSSFLLITYMFERDDLYINNSKLLSPSMIGIVIIFTFIFSTAIGKVIYHRPKKQWGANNKCYVCGQLQRHSRMAKCTKCNNWFCNFPLWKDHSIRRVLDGIALVIAVPVFILLTAFSILGGIIIMFILSIPYLLLRELFPESQMPSYWKNCGNVSLCDRCLSPAYQNATLTDSLGGISLVYDDSADYDYSKDDDNSSGGYSSDYDDRGRFENDNNDRGDGDKGGSIWDGWAHKW